MKLTVRFGEYKVVVPCGSGALSIRELAFSALKRVRHTFPKLGARDRIVVHSLSSARDGGLLDWDDSVCDVLDDRELVIAQYSIATLASCASSSQVKSLPSDQLLPSLCTPLIVDPFCQRETSDLFHGDSKLNDASGSSGSGSDHHRVDLSITSVVPTYSKHHQLISIPFSSVADESNSSSSLSLNLSANSCVVDHSINAHVCHVIGSGPETIRKISPLSELTSATSIRNPPVRCANKATETDDISQLDRSDAPFCILPSEFSLLRCSSPSPEIDMWNSRSNVEPSSLPPPVSVKNLESIFSILGRRRDCIGMNWSSEDDEGDDDRTPDRVWGDDQLSTLPSRTCLSFPNCSRVKSVENNLFSLTHHPTGTPSQPPVAVTDCASRPYNVCAFSSLPLSLTPLLHPTHPVELRVEPDDVKRNLLDGHSLLSSFGTMERSLSPHALEHAGPLCTRSEPALSATSSTRTKTEDVAVGYSPAMSSTTVTGISGALSDDSITCLSLLDLSKPLDAPADVHDTSLSALSDLFPTTCSATSGSRPLFCSLTVSTILEEEEEEEYSVDYDQSVLTNSARQSDHHANEHSSMHRILDDIDGERENLEEDYPLLRPDYFIGQDRLDQVSVINRLTERHHDSLLVTPDDIVKDDSVEGQLLTKGSVTLSPDPSCTSALHWLESSRVSDSLLSSSLTSTLDCANLSSNSSTTHGNTENNGLVDKTHFESIAVTTQSLSYIPGTVVVRFVNTKPGENLGIQIKPAFISTVQLSMDPAHHSGSRKKIESGLEVHNVLPNGRVARERCLSVGDRILSINGTSLTGVPFEKGRDLFQAALNQPEFTLEVLPLSSRPMVTKKCEEENCSAPTIMCNTDVSNEAGSQATLRPDKPAPPPPPRRSPNTVLTTPLSRMNYILSNVPPETHNVPTFSSNCNPVSAGQPNIITSVPISVSMPDCIPIYLQKGSSGLGFSLTSRELPDTKERVICVKSVLPDGAARMDGRLRPGDRLIQVGDLDVGVLGQARTVAWLRARPTNSLVKLLVWRPNENASTPRLKNRMNKSAGTDPVSVHPDVPPPRTNTQSTDTTSLLPERKGDLYKVHLIDSSQYLLMELNIPLPATNTSPSVVVSNKTSTENSSNSSPVTLGVSVSVRPLLTSSHREPKADKWSDNAVFVRTIIEGGPAHRDGRLQIGDRLLTIDDEPLSGLSSADALARLKAMIARDLADGQSYVRLLVARSRNYADSAPEDSTSTLTKRDTHVDVCGFRSQEMLQTTAASNSNVSPSASSPPVPPKCSVLVAAEVHTSSGSQTMVVPTPPIPSPSGSTHPRTKEVTLCSQVSPTVLTLAASHPQHSTSTHRSNHGKSRSKHHSHKSSRRLNHTSRKRYTSNAHIRSGTLQVHSSVKLMLNSKDSSAVIGALAGAYLSAESSQLTKTQSLSSIVSTSYDSLPQSSSDCAPPNFAKIYRCDSQGTISSAEMPEYDLHNDGARHAIALSPSDRSSKTVVSRVYPDYGMTQRSSSQISPSFSSHPPHHTRFASPSHGCSCSDRTASRIVFCQPQIDFSQMVLVPFDPDSWLGPVLKPRSALSSADLDWVDATEPRGRFASSVKNRCQSSLDHIESTTEQHSSPPRTTCETTTQSVSSTRSIDSGSSSVLHLNSGSSRKASLTSGNGPSERTPGKKIIGKLLHLVKSNTHRGLFLTSSSACTQTDADLQETLEEISVTTHAVNAEKPHAQNTSVTNPSPPFPNPMINSPSVVLSEPSNLTTSYCSPVDLQNLDAELETRATNEIDTHCRSCCLNRVLMNPIRIRPNSLKSAGLATYNTLPAASLHTYDVARPRLLSAIPSASSVVSEHHCHSTNLNTLPRNRATISSSPRPSGVYADLALQQSSVSLPEYNPVSSSLLRSEAHSREPITSPLSQPEVNKSFLNHLYESDVSSCSTAYESVVEFMEPVDGVSSPKQRIIRDVYEDASALYHSLADMKRQGNHEVDGAASTPVPTTDNSSSTPAQQSQNTC